MSKLPTLERRAYAHGIYAFSLALAFILVYHVGNLHIFITNALEC
jgi:hypothetical protein